MGVAEWLYLVFTTDELEVPPVKRPMVFSSGSNSIKAKVQEEEVYFQDISDTVVGVYAPNKVILEQALPKIKALLKEDEVSVLLYAILEYANIRVYANIKYS